VFRREIVTMQPSTARRPLLPTAVPALARRCAIAACLAAGTLLGAPAHAHESEQYTLPIGRDFADLGPYFTQIAYDAVVAAANETNAAIREVVEHGATGPSLATLQSSDYIAGKVWGQFFTAIPTNELLDATLLTAAVQARYPGLVTMYRPTVSIYDDALLVLDLTKAVRTFFRAGTVSAHGTEFGTDKIIHFINIGRIYHSKYETRIGRGLPPDEAVKSAIASTSRNPLLSEDGVLGMLTTGIHSNGDLAADYAGLLFYRNLTETVQIGQRILPPMLRRDGPYWRVQVDPDSDFFVAFITPHWNETYNPNRFANYTKGRLRALVADRCPDALDHYRDEHGQLRGRAEFEAIERELSTYYGVDYGHERNAERPVSLAAVCFSDKVAGAPANVAVAPAGGADAFGRTELWWAARNGDEALVRQLAATTDLNLADLDGETPLHAAVRAGSVPVARQLLALGATPDPAALYGVTPLLLAANRGRPEVAALLLAAGADPNRRDLFGSTPLHAAARRGNSVLALRLLENGADPRLVDDNGNSALHLAAQSGHESIVALLAARGADPGARNASGATPLEEALRGGHLSAARRLELQSQAGAMSPQATNAARPAQPD
jgi:hypothetical protein